MKALVLGGTGLISTGIVKHLLARGMNVTVFNRGQRTSDLPGEVEQLHGDRLDFPRFESLFADKKYDVVIDMICFLPEQAQSLIRAFQGRCEQVILCSTAGVIGSAHGEGIIADETPLNEPTLPYLKNKLECERVLFKAHAQQKFQVTVIRPGSTYGPGRGLLDNLEPPQAVCWDRIERGLPVLCAGDGLGFWNVLHRDDCSKAFAYAALRPKCYGEAYNATGEVFTWREYYRRAAKSLGKDAMMLYMPATWIVKHDPKRFAILNNFSRETNLFSNAKARRDIPEFGISTPFEVGAGQVLESMRGEKWKSTEGDTLYQSMVDSALHYGMEVEHA